MGQVNDRRLEAEDLAIQFDAALKSVKNGHYATARAQLNGAIMLINGIERRHMTGKAKLRETAAKLRLGVPCGWPRGPSAVCTENRLCQGCDARLKAAAEIEVTL